MHSWSWMLSHFCGPTISPACLSWYFIYYHASLLPSIRHFIQFSCFYFVYYAQFSFCWIYVKIKVVANVFSFYCILFYFVQFRKEIYIAMKILDRYIDQLLEKSSPSRPIWNALNFSRICKPLQNNRAWRGWFCNSGKYQRRSCVWWMDTFKNIIKFVCIQ